MTLHVDRLGAGPDLVLLHGWGLHGGAWSAVAARLARRFRVHVVDLPGHGHSPPGRFDGLDSLAGRIVAAIPPGSAVCGWSLGALVAMRLAALAQAGVRALGLVSATPSFVAREGWDAGLAPETLAAFASNLVRNREETERRFLHLTAKGAPGARAGVRQLESLRAERPPADAGGLADGLLVLATADLRAIAPSLAQPAVVIHGACDGLVPPEAGRRLASAMGEAAFVEIVEAAHAPLLTHPEAVAHALERLHG